jgi:hypothetical protein
VGKGDKEERVNSINGLYSGIHWGKIKELSGHGGKYPTISSEIFKDDVRPFLHYKLILHGKYLGYGIKRYLFKIICTVRQINLKIY